MKRLRNTIILLLLPLLFVAAALLVGRYSIRPQDVLQALFRPSQAAAESWRVIWFRRLPRAVAAAMCGAALAVSGAAFQGAVVLSYFAGRVSKVTTSVTLILGGVIVSSFFSALISILKYLADPYSQLPSITFWFMGSFASINYVHFYAFLPMALGMLLIFLSRWRINVLSMGDREAAALGVDVRRYKFLIIGGATLATASAVCISGTIGWVGLVVPHIGRMLVGNNNVRLIPVSMSLGACFLTLMDILSRCISTSEIPIGILCALIGTPFFVYLLKKTRGGGWA